LKATVKAISVDRQATWADAATVQGNDARWYLHVNVSDGNGAYYQYIVDDNGMINHRLYTNATTLDNFFNK